MNSDAVSRRMKALAEVSQLAVALKTAGKRELPTPTRVTLEKLHEAADEVSERLKRTTTES